MTDAGFFKGTSAEQDARFADKKKKLMKTMKFGENLSQKVDMSKINLDSIRPWIVKRITELLSFEDEVVCDYVFNQLEERHPDPKEIQINITGFLNSKNAMIFLSELWDLLLSAMQTPSGVPVAFLEAKKEEIAKRQEEELRVKSSARAMAASNMDGTRSHTDAVRMDINSSSVPPSKTSDSRPITQDSTTTKDVLRRRSKSRSSSLSGPRNTTRTSPVMEGPELPPKMPRRSRHGRSSSSRSSEGRHCVVDASRARSRGRSRSHSRSHRRRSGSDEKERRSKRRRSPGTDWRKDLMAGRRRSPPEMPDNGHYGREKHSKDHKRSKKHERHHKKHTDRDSHRRSTSRDIEDRRTYKHVHDSESRRNYRVPEPELLEDRVNHWSYSTRKDIPDGEYRRYEGPDLPERSDYRHSRRHSHRHRSHSRSVSPRHDRLMEYERAAKDQARRPQLIPEDEYNSKSVHDKRITQKEESPFDNKDDRLSKRSDNRSSVLTEGPELPPALKPKLESRTIEGRPQNVKKRTTSTSSTSSSSSSGSSSSSSSSSDGSSTGSSSSSDNSGSEESDNETGVVPVKELNVEGPELPPELVEPQPEGPALPPNEDAPEWTDKPQMEGPNASASSSDSSSSDSSSDDEHSGSSSSSSSGSSSSTDSGSTSSSESHSEGEVDDKKDHKRRKLERINKEIKKGTNGNFVPEGPALPPNHPGRTATKNQDSIEELLRQRALASLIRSSDKKRGSS